MNWNSRLILVTALLLAVALTKNSLILSQSSEEFNDDDGVVSDEIEVNSTVFFIIFFSLTQNTHHRAFERLYLKDVIFFCNEILISQSPRDCFFYL